MRNAFFLNFKKLLKAIDPTPKIWDY